MQKHIVEARLLQRDALDRRACQRFQHLCQILLAMRRADDKRSVCFAVKIAEQLLQRRV